MKKNIKEITDKIVYTTLLLGIFNFSFSYSEIFDPVFIGSNILIGLGIAVYLVFYVFLSFHKELKKEIFQKYAKLVLGLDNFVLIILKITTEIFIPNMNLTPFLIFIMTFLLVSNLFLMVLGYYLEGRVEIIET